MRAEGTALQWKEFDIRHEYDSREKLAGKHIHMCKNTSEVQRAPSSDTDIE